MGIFYIDSGSFGDIQVTGSLFVSNTINVNTINAQTSSIQYITSSQLNVGTNIITVNTSDPSVRFGGLSVIDSGSVPARSGSILFDSQNNQWIFIHQGDAGADVTSSIFIQGPQTFNNVGNETTLTTNRLTKASGGDLGEHIGDSNITDDGTTVSINSNTVISGTLMVGGEIMGIQGQILALTTNNSLFSGF